ncbi:MAG: 5-methyltetrahydropteroyltriglutamate--homocysteine S-methyltransferase [Candidatus Omnitrophica bacterium]|nr:5-methyltetrahydropteroyltriglutamate--homocysteine S-methyltransferase [Candidatus Omnitrophota bacterium]
MQTYAYGFPRLGKKRDFKIAVESFWDNKISDKELAALTAALEKDRLECYKKYVDIFPLGEFTYYDNILDTALIFGVYKFKNFDEYFEYARGKHSLALKKYFNTNYHYLVPSLPKNVKFFLSWNKPLHYFSSSPYFKDNPVSLIGPYTFLKLSRTSGNFSTLFYKLCESYKTLFTRLANNGVRLVHLEEPSFCCDVPSEEVRLIVNAYRNITSLSLKVNLITYYGSVDFLPRLYDIPFAAIGLDFISNVENLSLVSKNRFPKDKKLICGIVDGRGVKRSNLFDAVKFIRRIQRICRLKNENILISNSAPLFHLPVTLENETVLDISIRNNISFAQERLQELKLIKNAYEGKTEGSRSWCAGLLPSRASINEKKFDTLSLKPAEFIERKSIQQAALKLPLFPTTTIGSFPQDAQLRKARFEFKCKRLLLHDYDDFIRAKILKLIESEEELGLDVLVHGEFERSDMVEYFAQKLSGFITTDNGWVISYGTRVYRPPLIYKKIERSAPLTLKEIIYAQSLAPRIVKGIISGPVTILAWSYNLRQDAPYKLAFELACALNEEAKALEANNIRIIQIDEPALREFAPLKKRERNLYYRWAARAFNITAGLSPSTQIHMHLCYSEFGEIIKWILKMNFDVLTVESARDNGKILNELAGLGFNRGLGPGVWDIHSKYPASEKTIRTILDKAIKIVGARNIWVNPDCGLKTRDWPEVEASLRKMVKVAHIYRRRFKKVRRK